MTRSFVLSLCLMLGAALHAVAANGWERLMQLHSGDRITVEQTDGSQRSGEFVRVSPTELSVRTSGADRTIVRSDIRRVTSTRGSKALRNAAIGAGIGVGIAVTTDRTLGVRLNNEGQYSSGAKAAVWTIPIALGTALGALTGRNSTIYKAP